MSIHPCRKKCPEWPSLARSILLNTLAAALDKDCEHNYCKNASSYADEGYTIHCLSPFLMCEVFIKTLHYGDCRRTERYQKQ